MRSTRLKTVGGTTCVLPNSIVAGAILENFSTREARRVVVTLGLTYETRAGKMEEAMRIITESIQGIDGIRTDDVSVRFVNFGSFSLDLEVVYWITDMSDWKMIIHRVNMALKKNLDEAGVDLAFPTETHYLVNVGS